MQLIQSTAGGGKTATVIQAILHQKAQNPWDSIWVLLPNELQINTFRDRLIAANQGQVLFGVQYFQFYQLYKHLLSRLQLPQRHISYTGVYNILRALIRQESLSYFAPIENRAGFVYLLANFITELKQAHIPPDHFLSYAEASGRPKDHDLALIYQRYQQRLLEEQMVDREGAGWLALSELDRGDFSDVCMLVVDGFMQVSPLQAKLIEVLAAYIPTTLVTLTGSPTPRRVWYAFERMHERLNKYMAQNLSTAQEVEQSYVTPAQGYRHPLFDHLERYLFENDSPQFLAGDALTLIEAPNHEIEVRGVLRQIKARLLVGENPETMLITARDISPYDDLLRSVAHDYGVPLAFRRGLSLLQNPAVAALFKLLSLAHNNFKRQDVIDLWRSPYFAIDILSEEDQSILEQIAIRQKVMASAEDWFEAIAAAQAEFEDEDGNASPALDLPPSLRERLAAFFAMLTPPAKGTAQEYIKWIEMLLGPDPSDTRVEEAEGTLEHSPQGKPDLQFYTQARQDPLVAVRDIQALLSFRQTLRAAYIGRDLLQVGHEKITWESFLQELTELAKSQRINDTSTSFRHRRVLVTSTFDARGLPHQHVYVLGMAEGMLPAIQTEDPLYSDRERIAFENFSGFAGQYDLQTTTERQDDRAIFYEIVAQTQSSLTLTRPTQDANGNPWPPSMLWQAVQVLVTTPRRIRYRAGQAPSFAQAATHHEAEVALAAALHTTSPVDLAAAWQWMETHNPRRWLQIMRRAQIEAEREDGRIPFNRYSGRLSSPRLTAIVARMLSDQRLWSASQFNDFGYCPFRFFAGRILKLEALNEPEEGLDAAQLGSLQHAILEDTYRDFAENDIAIHPDQVESAIAKMHHYAGNIFADAPRRFKFRQSPLWEQEQAEIRRRLEALIRLDFSASGDSPFVASRSKNAITPIIHSADQERSVFRLESAFGSDGTPPARIHLAEGVEVLARGFIDRMDRIGDNLIVIDYKSGSHTPSNKDMETGHNFQMMLYLLAAQQIIQREEPQLRVGAGMFWSIRSRKASGIIAPDDTALSKAQEHLSNYLYGAQAGDFRVQPTQLDHSKCSSHCDFYQLCRVQRTRVYQGVEDT